jgi:hypothetical protein
MPGEGMREVPASQDGSFCLKIMGLATSCETGAIAMIDKAPSPLRQRMIEDMTVRNFKEKVQTDYIRHVKTFTAFLGRSPNTATSEDLRPRGGGAPLGGGARRFELDTDGTVAATAITEGRRVPLRNT